MYALQVDGDGFTHSVGTSLGSHNWVAVCEQSVLGQLSTQFFMGVHATLVVDVASVYVRQHTSPTPQSDASSHSIKNAGFGQLTPAFWQDVVFPGSWQH